jgi:hypothetical protein
VTTITTTAPALDPGPCWADPLTTAERTELRWRLAKYANAFFGAATPEQVHARTRDVLGALALGHTLMNACAEMQDLHLDVTERAEAAPDSLAALRLLAEVCAGRGCTHDRGSHYDGTGQCGFCGCGSFQAQVVAA